MRQSTSTASAPWARIASPNSDRPTFTARTCSGRGADNGLGGAEELATATDPLLRGADQGRLGCVEGSERLDGPVVGGRRFRGLVGGHAPYHLRGGSADRGPGEDDRPWVQHFGEVPAGEAQATADRLLGRIVEHPAADVDAPEALAARLADGRADQQVGAAVVDPAGLHDVLRQ